MRSIIKVLGLAFFATLAFSAASASSALALPLFLTLSKATLLVNGVGIKPVLRGEVAGVVSTVECEKVLIHGFVLHKTPLAHLLGLLFEGDCLQKIGSGASESCNSGNHITTLPVLAELGLLSSTDKKVVILLAPSEGKTDFVTFTCGNNPATTVSGAIVGEIPEKNAAGEQQIDAPPRTELEVNFATVSKNNQQAHTTIFLLGSEMTGVELKVSGLFGGKASEEALGNVLTANGPVVICTH